MLQLSSRLLKADARALHERHELLTRGHTRCRTSTRELDQMLQDIEASYNSTRPLKTFLQLCQLKSYFASKICVLILADRTGQGIESEDRFQRCSTDTRLLLQMLSEFTVLRRVVDSVFGTGGHKSRPVGTRAVNL